jgi:hypothetical protein
MPVQYSGTMNGASHFAFTGVACEAKTCHVPEFFSHSSLPAEDKPVTLLLSAFSVPGRGQQYGDG